MMKSERVQIIQERLQRLFSPSYLEVIDDSDQHIGHAGSRDGAGHYTVVILAEGFSGKTKVETHRMIYDALNDLIPKEIHALRIKTSL
jgi:BolA protein